MGICLDQKINIKKWFCTLERQIFLIEIFPNLLICNFIS